MEAMSRPMINHRGAEFKALFEEVLAGLGPVFGAAGDVLIFPSASTGGMEAAVVNTLSPGDRVLAVSIGYFGDRFARIAADFGADVVKLDVPWGQAADPAAIAAAVKADPTLKAVLVTHNETSTGVTNDVQAIAAALAGTGLLVVVDAVSSLAAMPLPADAWGLDVVVSGSQKALMVPPGLAFVSVSERAWQAHANARMPRHYWDFTAARKAQTKGQTPYTPAVSLVYGLAAALKMIAAEGLPNVYNRHRALAGELRAGLSRLGLQLFADPAHASNTVTSVVVPDSMSGKDLVARLRVEHGVVVAGGQGRLDGRIFRVGHMGWVSEKDIRDVLAAVKAVLA
jgi:aspartate aminotransferase-like enzyme